MINLVADIKDKKMLSLMGGEALSLTESIGSFFKELSLSVDKKMIGMGKTIHAVDYLPTKRYLENNKILFTQNTGVEITAPSHFTGDFAELNSYVNHLISSIFVVSTLKSETTSMYKWLKDIVKTGRYDSSYRWASLLTDDQIMKTEQFLTGLPAPTNKTYRLEQMYSNFEECFNMISHYNIAIKGIKGRDIELITKELAAIYHMGSLLVAKIEANELLLSPDTINEISFIVNKWINLVNVSAAIVGLLNELTAVFTEQLKQMQLLKK